MSLELVTDALRKMTGELNHDNDDMDVHTIEFVRISESDLRAILQDAIDDVRRVVIEANYPYGPGYEVNSCVGGDYVPAEEVDALVEKIMKEVCE